LLSFQILFFGVEVQGSGFRVQGAGSGFRVQGSGFRVQGLLNSVNKMAWVVEFNFEV